MFIFIAFLLANCATAIAYYFVAMVSAMPSGRWALVGIIFGMFALPLFVIQRHIQWRRSVGFGNQYFAA